MSARCKTKLPASVQWAVTLTNGAGFGESEVRVVLRFDGRTVRGMVNDLVAVNEPERIDYHVERMWRDFMRHLHAHGLTVEE